MGQTIFWSLPAVGLLAMIAVLAWNYEMDASGMRQTTRQMEAAAAGDPGAMYAAGVAFRLVYGVDRDEAKALEWFRQAAEAGHPRAAKVVPAVGISTHAPKNSKFACISSAQG